MNRVHSLALVVLTVLTLLSLLLNAIVIHTLLEARRTALRVVQDTRSLVDELSDDVFLYSVQVEQDVPISAEVPFNETFTIPVNTVVPIDTSVVVPVDLGITTYRLRIPINTVFPVDIEFTVPVSQMIALDTVVPIDIEVPLDIPLSETPLGGYLRDAEAVLRQTEEQLKGPVW